MGTKELSHAYPRLKREWHHCAGRVVRLNPLGMKGISDFILTHYSIGPYLVEVKCVPFIKSQIGLESHQADFLDDMKICGTEGRVLVWCMEDAQWGIFHSGTLFEIYKGLRYFNATRKFGVLTPANLKGE
jgi:hypothetical protein